MEILNKSAPFGTILIIYESRPDVTVEAAALAFKAGSKILLKGGKEARQSNLALVALWHQALSSHLLPLDWIQYLGLFKARNYRSIKEIFAFDRPGGAQGW
jgi:glutamate-5-semialdehyde dehydrogenase